MFTFPRVRALLASVAIGFAVLQMLQALHTAEGIQGGLNDAPLDPEAFRVGIYEVESRLYAPGPLSMEARIRVSKAFHDLAVIVKQDGETHLSQYGAREMQTLAGLCQGLGPLEGDALERIRTQWHRIRANTFADTWWYRWSEADPVVPPDVQPPG